MNDVSEIRRIGKLLFLRRTRGLSSPQLLKRIAEKVDGIRSQQLRQSEYLEGLANRLYALEGTVEQLRKTNSPTVNAVLHEVTTTFDPIVRGMAADVAIVKNRQQAAEFTLRNLLRLFPE